MQPPDGAVQRPGVDAVAPVQSPEQQSAARVQMSPVAWQLYAGTQVPP
jgi:hypothetical protein